MTASTEKELTTIGFIADLHVEADVVEAMFDALKETLEAFRDADPDLIVVLGDLIQESTPAADEELLERTVDLLDTADAPVRFLAGNHDVETLSRPRLESAYGHGLWTVDADADLAFLDTAAPRLAGARGELDEEQIDALCDALPRMSRAVVAAHHPLHYHDVSDNRWFGRYPEEAFCGNKRAVEDLLVRDNVCAVVTGHLHERDVTVVDRVPHVTVDAFNKRHVEGETTGAYALLRRTESRVTIEHVSGDGTEHAVSYPLGR